MLSRPLVITALLFQVAGVVWGLVLAFQEKTLDLFFSAEKWPIYVGFVLLIVAVMQSKSLRRVKAEEEFVSAAKDALQEDEEDVQDKNEQAQDQQSQEAQTESPDKEPPTKQQ